MARRYTIRLRCAAEGCPAGSVAEACTRHEENEARRWYAEHPYRCYRHQAPAEVLSAAEPVMHGALRVTQQGPSKYWAVEADGRLRGGLVSGPGIRAIADDFPEGTRLLVTAEIELPSGGE